MEDLSSNSKMAKPKVEEPMLRRANAAEENGYKPEEIYEKEDGLFYEKATGNPIHKRFSGIPWDDDAQKKWDEH